MRSTQIALVILALALCAADASADALYDKCMDASDGTNPGYGDCGGQWIARADVKLNQAWKELYAEAQEKSQQDLLNEQRLWNAYKEKSCVFLANGDYGREGQVIHFPACRAQVIEDRTTQLQRYLSPED